MFHLGGRGRRGWWDDSLFEYICVFDVGKSIISTRGLVTTDAFLFSFFKKKNFKIFWGKMSLPKKLPLRLYFLKKLMHFKE